MGPVALGWAGGFPQPASARRTFGSRTTELVAVADTIIGDGPGDAVDGNPGNGNWTSTRQVQAESVGASRLREVEQAVIGDVLALAARPAAVLRLATFTFC